jgi:ubiquinone/menaquinone biosynthesis C-methylase UbiE
MDSETSTVDLDLFKQNWLTYKTIIDENYMFHREVIQATRQCLSSYFGNDPIAVLDLGCGDASNVAKTLEGFNVGFFCGYDLSAMALQLAENNIAELTENYQLNCQDMLQGAAEKDNEFDLILSSYSMHHFKTDDKAALFSSVYGALKKGGIFVLVDTIRGTDELLDDYYDHYLGHVRQNWVALSQNEIERVCDHVRCSDFPENAQTLQQIAQAAGFGRLAVLAKHNWHQLVVFYKPTH